MLRGNKLYAAMLWFTLRRPVFGNEIFINAVGEAGGSVCVSVPFPHQLSHTTTDKLLMCQFPKHQSNVTDFNLLLKICRGTLF